MLDDVKREQRARIFRNGRSRAVRIPKEFDFEGDEVTIRKEADGSIRLVPDKKQMSPRELVEWLKANPAQQDFPDADESDMLPLDDIKF
jgi:antitoxin VapB